MNSSGSRWSAQFELFIGLKVLVAETPGHLVKPHNEWGSMSTSYRSTELSNFEYRLNIEF